MASTPAEDAAPVLTPEQVAPLIEALLFVADGPVEEAALARTLGLTRRQIDAPLTVLGESLRERGVRLQRGPDGAQLVTAPAAASYIEQFLGLEAARKLSPAALETLAIIAYRQPVTRGTLEAIRGVSCDGPIDTLRTRGLIDVAGRADGPGRPALFATTQKFLEHFGLERAEDLPALPPDVAELASGLPERAEQLALDAIAAIASDETEVPTALDAASEAEAPATELAPATDESSHDSTEPAIEVEETQVESVAMPRTSLAGLLPDLSVGLPGTTSGPFAPPSASGAMLPPTNSGLPFGG